MWTTAQLLCAIGLPMGLGLLLTIATSDLRRTAGRLGIGGLVLALVVLVAHAATAAAVDAPLLPPHSGWHWLPWAIAGLSPAMLALPPGWWRWVVQIAVAAIGGAMLLHPVCHSQQDLLASGAWIAAAVLSVVLTGILRTSAVTAGALVAKSGSSGVPVRSLVEMAAAAIACGFVAAGAGVSGSKDLALLALIMPLAIAGMAAARVSSAWALGDQKTGDQKTGDQWTGGSLASAHLIAWHVLLNGNYSEMPWFGALPLALALPAGMLASRCGRCERSAIIWRLGVTMLIASLGVGLILACGQPAAVSGSGW